MICTRFLLVYSLCLSWSIKHLIRFYWVFFFAIYCSINQIMNSFQKIYMSLKLYFFLNFRQMPWKTKTYRVSCLCSVCYLCMHNFHFRVVFDSVHRITLLHDQTQTGTNFFFDCSCLMLAFIQFINICQKYRVPYFCLCTIQNLGKFSLLRSSVLVGRLYI